MENRTQENENNIILGGFNCTMDKMTGMMETKYKKLIDVVLILRCLNSSWIMSWRVCGGWRTQIPLSSTATTDPLAQDPGLTEFILT